MWVKRLTVSFWREELDRRLPGGLPDLTGCAFRRSNLMLCEAEVVDEKWRRVPLSDAEALF